MNATRFTITIRETTPKPRHGCGSRVRWNIESKLTGTLESDPGLCDIADHLRSVFDERFAAWMKADFNDTAEEIEI